MNDTWKFLLLLMQQHVFPEKTLLLVDTFSKFHQDQLWNLLQQHRLISVAYPLLKKILPQDHPLLQKMQADVLNYSLRNLQQQKILSDIARHFEKENISYAALKGAALNQLLYQNQCFRYSSDIDILIAPKEAAKAHQLLISKGFTLREPVKEKIITDRRLFDRAKLKDIGYITPTHKFLLEIHYHTNDIYEPEIGLSQDIPPSTVVIQQQNITLFPPEENFIYLAWHGAKHSWSRLQWLLDLAMFQKVVLLDWIKLERLAKTYDCQRAVYEALLLLNTFFHIPIPNFSLTRCDRLAIKIHLGSVKKEWENENDKHNRWTNNIFQTLLYSTWENKKRFIKNKLHLKNFANAL